MKPVFIVVAVILGVGVGFAVASAVRRPAQTEHDASAPSAHAAAGYTPSLGEVMHRVGGSFADAYFAADARNWPLVGYHVHELEETLERAPAVHPRENGVELRPIIEAALRANIPELEQAAEREDIGAFRRAYAGMLSTCNACHGATGHGYLIVDFPTAPRTTNLRLEPAR